MGNHDSEWTIRTLRVFLEGQIAALRSAAALALSAQEKAANKLENQYDRRFEAANEFRATLNDQAGTFITRLEYETAHLALEDKFDKLNDRMNLREGNASGRTQLWAFLVAAVAAIGTIVIVTNVLLAR